jgi:cystathionine gamma-synthase
MPHAIETPIGTAMPPCPRHAITTHLPEWKQAAQVRDQDPEIFKVFKNMYPRFVLHRDVLEVSP